MLAALGWLGAAGPAHGIGGLVLRSGRSGAGHLTAIALSHSLVGVGSPSSVFSSPALAQRYLNERLALTDAEIATLSPLRLPPAPKPLAIACGAAELFSLVRDSGALRARRAAAHSPGALLLIARANHFTVLDELASPTGALTRLAVSMLP
jgi:arylformamidase